MFQNILVAVDGSPHADQALTEAIDLAASEHARLTLFTAVAPGALGYSGSGEAVVVAIEAAEGEAGAILQDARARVPDHVPVATVVSSEPVMSALIHQITSGDHDLVVMGSRGRGRSARRCSAASASTSCTTARFPSWSSTPGSRPDPLTVASWRPATRRRSR